MASDQVRDVEVILGERGTPLTWNRNLVFGEQRRIGDRIHTRELQDDSALMQPVVFDLRLSRRRFPVWRQQPDVSAFFEAVRKVCQDVGDQLAMTTLRADQVRQQNKVALPIFKRHDRGDQPAVVDSLPPMGVPSTSSSSSSSSSSTTSSS